MGERKVSNIDKKAKKVLFSYFWKSGWIDEQDRKISPADLKYAMSHGVMFEPVSFSHNEAIQRIQKVLSEVPEEQFIKAVLSSLSTQRLDWRSAFASYSLAKSISSHSYTPVESGRDYSGTVSYTCKVCRDSRYGIIGDDTYSDVDLNVLNFERLKWGGVRHGKLDYMMFDLESFRHLEISDPTKEDIAILEKILKTIEESQDDDSLTDLVGNLKNAVRGTRDEIRGLVEILGAAGILKAGEEVRARHGKSDWVFVANWCGKDKYDQETVERLFGSRTIIG